MTVWLNALDPFALYADWYKEAVKKEPNDPNAAALATVAPDGMPSVRMVLVKDFSPDGFTFFTNYDSRKADHLLTTPSAAMCLHWKSLQRQVRIEGDVQRIADSASDVYFATRPHDSQIGAWASLQSRPLPKRADFTARLTEYQAKYPKKVPRPPHWGGYILMPRMIEFWQGRENRWHERLVFTAQQSGWATMQLYP